MPIEGISMTTVFSLIAVGLALSLSIYIGGYYLRPIFDVDSLIASVAYDIATIYDLAYTLPGEVTIKYYGPSSCSWNYNLQGDDIKAFRCIDSTSVILKGVYVDKEYLIVYDDPYIKHDSNNDDLKDNFIFNYMGSSDLSQAIGYPRLSYLTIQIPYYNRQISAQTDFENAQISYGSLAVAPFAGSYSDTAMAASTTPYEVSVDDYAFVVSKYDVGTYFQTISNNTYIPQELLTFLSYVGAVYNNICIDGAQSGYYVYDTGNYESRIESDLDLNDYFLMLLKGYRIKSYSSNIALDKLYDGWSFNQGNYSVKNKEDLVEKNNPKIINGLLYNAYELDGSNYLQTQTSNYNFDTFSISTWFYLNEYNTDYGTYDSMIINKDSGNNAGYRLYVDSSTHKLIFKTLNGVNINSNVQSEDEILLKKWYHVTGVVNQSHMLLYVDGELNSITPLEFTPDKTAKITIGKYGWGSDGYFTGIIDDVKIFNSDLTDTEVKSIYNSLGENEICQERISITTDEDQLYSELYDYFEMSNTNSFYSNIITNSNVAIVAGNKSNAFSYNKGYSLLNTELNNEELSINMWIKPSVTPSEYGYLLSTTSEDSYGYSIRINNENKIQVYLRNEESSAIVTSNLPVELNTWTNLIVTYNEGEVNIYLNGTKDTSELTSVYYFDTISYDMTLGAIASHLETEQKYYYTGIIDELKLYDVQLTDSQVNYVYNHIDELYTNELMANIKTNDYVTEYCFDVETFTQTRTCENIKQVVIDSNFINVINNENNFYAGWNSCTKPYVYYDSVSKKLIINARKADYNIIAGGCSNAN